MFRARFVTLLLLLSVGAQSTDASAQPAAGEQPGTSGAVAPGTQPPVAASATPTAPATSEPMAPPAPASGGAIPPSPSQAASEAAPPSPGASEAPASDTSPSDVTPERAPSAPPERSAAGSRDAAAPSQADPEPELDEIFEPPLPEPYYGREPELTPPPPHVAPKTSLWLGARTGWLFPFGSLWQDGTAPNGLCCVYERRAFDDFATSGPLLEIDVGARLGRHYNVFALWEWGILRSGDELGDAFGGQTSARTHFLGAGLRFSSDPDDIGIIVEMAVGWRQFEASWEHGTRFTATDDFFNTRIGIGADIRVDSEWSLSPMLTLGSGVFGEAEWEFADGSTAGAFSSFLGTPVDEPGQHIPVSLQLAVHYDAFGAMR